MSQQSQTTKKNTVVAKAAGAADVEVTAYTSGPAIFREKRVLTLPAGKSEVLLAGLPETFVANSLTVTDVVGDGRLKLGALSYREASLSLEAILQKAVGTEVTLIERTNAGELKTTGKLLHVLGNQAVLDCQGRVTVSPITERMNLDQATLAGLSTTASLQLTQNAPSAGNYSVSILFAAEGLSWNLSYEIFYDAKSEKMARFACWVNLTNKSGADIDAAKIKLIFGANTGYNDYSNARPRGGARAMAAMAPQAASFGGAALESASFDADSASVESVGEQKLYTLPDTLSVAKDETKQTLLFISENVPVTPEYHLGWSNYHHDPDGQYTQQNKVPVSVRLKVDNTKEKALGLALPPGSVKVFEKDSTGSLQRTDSTRVASHVAAGEGFELALQTPCKDIKGTRRLTFFKDDPMPEPVKPVNGEQPKEPVEKKPRFREEEREIVLYNYKDTDVEVKVQDSLPHTFEFIKPIEGVKNLANVGGTHTYTVSVPKNGQTKLVYRIKHQIG